MTNVNINMAKQRPVALVTGATGFIGGHIARRLVRDGWQVHILTRAGSRLPTTPEFSQIINNVHDGSTEGMVRCVAQSNPDVVFHIASHVLSSHTAKDVDSLIASNVLFGNQLLEAMEVNEIKKIINTGTFWQNYNKEEYNPVCLYAATKQAFEAILEYYVQACGVEAITLKLFDSYGSDDPRPKLFNLLNKSAESGEPLDMSAGAQLIDIVHIDDVTEAYVIAAERLLCGVVSIHEYYEVSSGHQMPLRELVEKYAEFSGQNIQVNWGARLYRDREVMEPLNMGIALPGWRVKVDLQSGIRQMLSAQVIPTN